MAETQTVRFLRSNSPYAKGEVAGIPKKHAERLIKRRIAEPSSAGEAKAKKAPADKMVRSGRSVQK